MCHQIKETVLGCVDRRGYRRDRRDVGVELILATEAVAIRTRALCLRRNAGIFKCGHLELLLGQKISKGFFVQFYFILHLPLRIIYQIHRRVLRNFITATRSVLEVIKSTLFIDERTIVLEVLDDKESKLLSLE